MTAPAIRFPHWAQITDVRRAHVERVVELIVEWAEALAVSDRERQRWLTAVRLHDALKDAADELLRELAPDAWGVDALRHGPAAAELAARHGEIDQGVLDAVRYHSVGYANWDAVGQMLYLADYLDPGRGFKREELARLRARVPEDPQGALRVVAHERIAQILAAGCRLLPETVAFWNVLGCGD